MPTAPVPIAEQKIMRLKKTVAVALATALLATTAAVPAFAADTTTKQITIKANDAGNGYNQYLDGSDTPSEGFDTTKNTSTGTTEVIYKVTETYTWSIPKTIDFGADQGINKTVVVNTTGTGTEKTNVVYVEANTGSKVSVDKNVIPEGKKLQIKIKGENYDDTAGYRVKNGNNNYLGYTITKDSDNTNAALGNDVVLFAVDAGTNSHNENLTFKLTTNNSQDSNANISEVAGSYKDTLTFTATVENQTNG